MGAETKDEEKKPAEEEKKEEEKKEQEPEEIILKVYMHCEACARKVEKSLRKFEGVEDVKTDYKLHRVVVKGNTADPVKVCERVQKKTGRKVEIISPLPKPLEEKKEEEPPKEEEKKEEPPAVITVVLLINMHCEACSQVLQKRIRKMDGVESVKTDLTKNQVVVQGVIDPTKIVETIYKKTGKQAQIVPQEENKEEEKEEGEKKEEEKKEEEKKEKEENKNNDLKKSVYWHPTYHVEYVYPPEIFSDENPNACSSM